MCKNHQNNTSSTDIAKGIVFLVMCIFIFRFWLEILRLIIFSAIVYAIGWCLYRYHQEIWQALRVGTIWIKNKLAHAWNHFKNRRLKSVPEHCSSKQLHQATDVDADNNAEPYCKSSPHYGKIRQ